MVPKKINDTTNREITLKEGNTPLTVSDGIYFKCEYQNPTGSVKDRGVSYQINSLIQTNIKKAVISSSGNAGISAAAYCRLAGIELTVFVSDHIVREKFERLEKSDCKIIKKKRPVQSAFLYAEESGAYNLRQSRDPNGTPGYRSLGIELSRELPSADAVFLPVSSGSTAVGMYEGFRQSGKNPSLHIVQTGKIHPIAGKYDHNYEESSSSLADAIVARYTPKQAEVEKIIQESNGSGWIVGDTEIKKATTYLHTHNLFCSYEGGAALAAFYKSQITGFKFRQPVIVLTGKFYGKAL